MENHPDFFFTVDVEDWFHILDTPAAPPLESWGSLETRVERGMRPLLDLLARHRIKATFFWLGWVAERQPQLVRECRLMGHEIASHGYAHVLAYQVGKHRFREDTKRAKEILEDIVGEPVAGYRAPGFGITAETPWAFDVLAEVGHTYDSSIFPAERGHGGIRDAAMGHHVISTAHGPLDEIPMSVVEVAGRRIMLFGGGYLRLAPLPLVRWGCRHLGRKNLPVVIYIHPREVDPDHPRLPLPAGRRFKCYVNLKSTLPKLDALCGMGASRFHPIGRWLEKRRAVRTAVPATNHPVLLTHGEAS